MALCSVRQAPDVSQYYVPLPYLERCCVPPGRRMMFRNIAHRCLSGNGVVFRPAGVSCSAYGHRLYHTISGGKQV